jgi:hypothetical protein
MQQDNNHNTSIEKLIEQENWKEAKAALERLLEQPLTDKEKGWLYTNLAIMYMKLNNFFDEGYQDAISDIINSISKVNSLKSKTPDAN